MSDNHTPAPAERTRVRIRFWKDGPLRFTSHLDLQKIWERLFRRTGIPVAYSQGFSPHPQIQLAAALPLGYRSTAEIVDVICTLPLPVTVDEMGGILQTAAPEGLNIQSVSEVTLKHPALQSLTTAATYRIDFFTSVGDMNGKITGLMAEETLPRTKHNGKSYDMRPLILALSQESETAIVMTLALSQQGSGRPDDVIDALGADPLGGVITRTDLHFSTTID